MTRNPSLAPVSQPAGGISGGPSPNAGTQVPNEILAFLISANHFYADDWAVAAAAAEAAGENSDTGSQALKRQKAGPVPNSVLAFVIFADLVVAAGPGGGSVRPRGTSADTGKTASSAARSGRASSASGGEGQQAPGDCSPAPFTKVVVQVSLPLRVLPASADRPKPHKPILRHVSAAGALSMPDPASLVSPPLPRRPAMRRAVIFRRAR